MTEDKDLALSTLGEEVSGPMLSSLAPAVVLVHCLLKMEKYFSTMFHLTDTITLFCKVGGEIKLDKLFVCHRH